MLRELYIRNFILFREAKIHLNSSLVVISGETGGGKSILLEVLRFLFGSKAKGDYVGKYGPKTTVVGVVELSDRLAALLEEELGVEAENGEIAIKRELGANRRSRCFLNGVPTSVGVLKKLGGYLMDIHSQDDQQSLLHSDFYRSMLDQFAGHGEILEEYTQSYRHWQQLQKRKQQLQEQSKDRNTRMEFLQFQLEELENLDLQKGEKQELLERHHRLSHRVEIWQNCQNFLDILSDGEQALDYQLGRIKSESERLASLDKRFSEVVNLAQEALISINQMVLLLRELSQQEDDPDTLEKLEQRLGEIEAMERKYHREADELFELKDELAAELDSLNHLDSLLEKVNQDLELTEEKLQQLGQQLRQNRQNAGARLAQQLQQEIQELGMKGATFQIRLQPLGKSAFGPKGLDQVEFWISTNPGMDLAPLASITSGGEMSRIMLALKSIFSEKYSTPILFFDEIDTNIGGRLAQVIGERFKKLSQDHQVFCITHLPQIAALGKEHLKIKKIVENDRTRTEILPLSAEGRVAEIAEMIRGEEVSATTLQQARELLEQH